MAFDGFPLILDGPMAPGESRRVGYVFLSSKEAVRYLRAADKFYLWEGHLIGEATIVEADGTG